MRKEIYFYNTSTGIHKPNNQEKDFDVFPNPATDIIYTPTGTELKLYDMYGRLLINEVSTGSTNIMSLSPGCYYVKIGAKMQSKTQKLIIK